MPEELENQNSSEETAPVEGAAPAEGTAAEAGASTEEAAAAAKEAALPENTVTVEDAGTLKKKVTVIVPRERIDYAYNEMFGELSKSAQIPGFRVGHAPRRLIEKRFGKEVSQDVRNSVIGDSLPKAVEKAGLKPIGEPDLDLEKVELPEKGEMTFSFEIEVAPEFTLPETKGIKVNKPKVEISEQRIDEMLEEWRSSQATYEVTENPAAEGDAILADVVISGEGITASEHKAQAMRVAPGQVEGLPLVDLGKELTGKKVGDKAVLKVKVPAAHPNEEWREKEVSVELTLQEVRGRKLPELNEEYAKTAGFESLAELRELARRRMDTRAQDEVQESMRQQINKYLLDNVQIDLPEGLVNRQTVRVLQRQYMELLRMGVPRERIDENLTKLQAGAAEVAQREMKLSFILGKFAEAEGITVDDGEVNSRIAMIARQSQRRPERVRQEMTADGTLDLVSDSIRDEKAVEILLGRAEITEVTAEQAAPPPADSGAEKA